MLADWGTKGQSLTWKWFQIWELSDHKQLPFAGAWVDQPSYVTDDFEKYKLVGRWWQLNEKKAEVKGLPPVS